MNETIESAVDRGSETAVTKADTTSTIGDIGTGHRQESETAVQSAVDSTETTERPELPLDAMFELLRNQRRRYVLQYLQGTKREVTLSELAEQIAAWENDKPVGQITSSERKRVYVGLYQCHLPKMDGMGVISFNKPRGLIERGEHADAVEPYALRAAAPERPSRPKPTVAPSIVGATMLPVAIITLSQSTLSLGVAALVVLAATAWGVLALRREGSEGAGDPRESTVA